jgi:AhpD family alkylhydroperoxidase
MTNQPFPNVTPDLSRLRHQLSPDTAAAFHKFSETVFADGALSRITKHIIAVAAAHVTQCPYCIKGHTRTALREGATNEQLMEAIWVAAEMRAGAAFAHSIIAVSAMETHASPVLAAPRWAGRAAVTRGI